MAGCVQQPKQTKKQREKAAKLLQLERKTEQAHATLQGAMQNMEQQGVGCASSRLLAVPHCAWQSLCSLHWSLTCGMARGTWQGQHAARG